MVPDALIAAFSQRSADIEAAVDTAIAAQVERTGRRPSIAVGRTGSGNTSPWPPGTASSTRPSRPPSQQWQATARRGPRTGTPPTGPRHRHRDGPRAGGCCGAGDVARRRRRRGSRLRVVDAVAARPVDVDPVEPDRRDDAAARRRRAGSSPAPPTRSRCGTGSSPRPSGCRSRSPRRSWPPSRTRSATSDGTSQLARPTVFTSPAGARGRGHAARARRRPDRTAGRPRTARNAIAAQPLPGRGVRAWRRRIRRRPRSRSSPPGGWWTCWSGRPAPGRPPRWPGSGRCGRPSTAPARVVGLAPSAIAAQVLAADLGIATDNTAQWLAQQHQQPAREQRIATLTGLRDRAAAAGRDTTTLDAALDRGARGVRPVAAAAGAVADRGRGRPGRHLHPRRARRAGQGRPARSCCWSATRASSPRSRPAAPSACSAAARPGPADPDRGAPVHRPGRHPPHLGRSTPPPACASATPPPPAPTVDHGRVHGGDRDDDHRRRLHRVAHRHPRRPVQRAHRRRHRHRPRAERTRPRRPRRRRHRRRPAHRRPARRPARRPRRPDRHPPDRPQPPRRHHPDRSPARRPDGFVRNGQRWLVDRVHRDGSLTVRLLDDDRHARRGPRSPCPPATCGEHVELGVRDHRAPRPGHHRRHRARPRRRRRPPGKRSTSR